MGPRSDGRGVLRPCSRAISEKQRHSRPCTKVSAYNRLAFKRLKMVTIYVSGLLRMISGVIRTFRERLSSAATSGVGVLGWLGPGNSETRPRLKPLPDDSVGTPAAAVHFYPQVI